MELDLDFALGASVFTLALVLAVYALVPLSLPPPKPQRPPPQPVAIEIRGGRVVADKVVRVWIVAFLEDGSYYVVEANTPAPLPSAQFVAVFTGWTAAYKGTPSSSLSGYITRRGVVSERPEPPYIRVEDGKVVEVVPRE